MSVFLSWEVHLIPAVDLIRWWSQRWFLAVYSHPWRRWNKHQHLQVRGNGSLGRNMVDEFLQAENELLAQATKFKYLRILFRSDVILHLVGLEWCWQMQVFHQLGIVKTWLSSNPPNPWPWTPGCDKIMRSGCEGIRAGLLMLWTHPSGRRSRGRSRTH